MFTTHILLQNRHYDSHHKNHLSVLFPLPLLQLTRISGVLELSCIFFPCCALTLFKVRKK